MKSKKSDNTAKETINKTKTRPMEREKIFANDETGKGLISKIHKQFTQLNNSKTNNQKGTRLRVTLEGCNDWLVRSHIRLEAGLTA